MRILEIKGFDNGAHRNQTGTFNIVPNGWAVVPENIDTPNFPFGEVETKEIDGVMTVTKWTPTDIPKTENTLAPNEIERLRADVDYIAIMTGVAL